jgi:hypothetical protein
MQYAGGMPLSSSKAVSLANGDLMYTFHRPWSDGTTGIKLSPLGLLERLAAFVSLPEALTDPILGGMSRPLTPHSDTALDISLLSSDNRWR